MGGTEKVQNYADVIYGWSLRSTAKLECEYVLLYSKDDESGKNIRQDWQKEGMAIIHNYLKSPSQNLENSFFGSNWYMEDKIRKFPFQCLKQPANGRYGIPFPLGSVGGWLELVTRLLAPYLSALDF